MAAFRASWLPKHPVTHAISTPSEEITLRGIQPCGNSPHCSLTFVRRQTAPSNLGSQPSSPVLPLAHSVAQGKVSPTESFPQLLAYSRHPINIVVAECPVCLSFVRQKCHSVGKCISKEDPGDLGWPRPQHGAPSRPQMRQQVPG